MQLLKLGCPRDLKSSYDRRKLWPKSSLADSLAKIPLWDMVLTSWMQERAYLSWVPYHLFEYSRLNLSWERQKCCLLHLSVVYFGLDLHIVQRILYKGMLQMWGSLFEKHRRDFFFHRLNLWIEHITASSLLQRTFLVHLGISVFESPHVKGEKLSIL